MSAILITMNEDSGATNERHFGVTYKVDEHDCLDYTSFSAFAFDFIDTAAGPPLMEAELLNPAAFANYSGKGRAFGREVAGYLNDLIASNSLGAPLRELQAAQ